MKTHVAVLVAVLCTSCSTWTTYLDDQIPYAYYMMHKGKILKHDDRGRLRLSDGPHIVLEIRQGRYASMASTAHANHDAIYLRLPTNVVEETTYSLSEAGGDLAYNGFAGYDRWCLDKRTKNVAVVDLWRLRDDSATAEVVIDCVVKPEPRPGEKESRIRRRVKAMGEFYFTTPERMQSCTTCGW